jgi:hypothetical protein
MDSLWRSIDSRAEEVAFDSGGDLELAAQQVQEAEDVFLELVEKSGRGKPKSIIDVFSMPGGQQWWKQYGGDIDLHFDVRPRSQSRETLLSYLDSRKKKKRSVVPNEKSERSSDWDITDEDEAVLDEVWQKFIENGAPPVSAEDEKFLEEIKKNGRS